MTSTDLASGERRVWNDSAATNAAGRVDHVFWSHFRPDFGSRHRIDVERSDGAASSVEVDIPVQVNVEQEDTGTRHFVVYIRGESFRLVRVEAVYAVRRAQQWDRTDLGRNDSPCKTPQRSYAFRYSGSELETGNGVRVDIDLDFHYFTMAGYYGHDTGINFDKKFPFSNGLALMGMELRVLIGNESWSPPGGEFDPNVLVQPGTLRNVQNGFGFVGAGYNQDFALYPSEQSLDDTWFFDYMMRPPNDCFDYCSCGLE